MPVAWIALRDGPAYRRECYETGLSRLGYSIARGASIKPKDGDVLLIWNRGRTAHAAACLYERRGLNVIVTENGYLWGEEKQYALSIGHHNGLGKWPNGGPERWESLGIDVKPWRDSGECVVLAQRGIGERGIAQPHEWIGRVRSLGRLRAHPGKNPAKPLEQDLSKAGSVVTWGSAAAIKALVWGIPVFYGLKGWIGALASRPVAEIGKPKKDDADRLAMLQRLAWAQWSIGEIRSGEAFARVLERA